MSRQQLKREFKRALSAQDIEEFYGIDAGYLGNLRWQKRGPKYYRLPGGSKIYYTRAEFESWFFGNPIETRDSLKN